jgi:hypothetical protein
MAAEGFGPPGACHRRRMLRADAAELVRLMAGRFRVPDALPRADQLARTGQRAAAHGSHHPG